MSNFRYRGRSGRGDLITGRLEADDIDAVAARLLNLGITPLEIAPDAARGATVHDVLHSLESGRDFASSLARHPDIFAPLFISMVRVGESTGTLDNSFLRLCEYLSQDQEVQDRVKSAVRYPLIVVGVIGLAMVVITVFVIPNFAPLF